MTVDVERHARGLPARAPRDLSRDLGADPGARDAGRGAGARRAAAAFRFPDDLWARVVYDFALGHHYAVVHRDHLLRSLAPLYLGRTAAFVLATARRGAAASQAQLDAVAAAFERQKPYLVEHWR